MLQEKVCGIVVYKKENEQLKFLIIKHNSPTRENYWNFPKGHVEADETEEQTARREVWEETGIKAKIIPDFRQEYKYDVVTVGLKPINKTAVYFLGQPENDHIQIDPVEIAQCHWLTYEDAREKITYDGSKQVLDEALKYIKN
ncbi:MAG: NUDIX domain-containing protein [Patescibacteria group bacterium]